MEEAKCACFPSIFGRRGARSGAGVRQAERQGGKLGEADVQASQPAQGEKFKEQCASGSLDLALDISRSSERQSPTAVAHTTSELDPQLPCAGTALTPSVQAADVAPGLPAGGSDSRQQDAQQQGLVQQQQQQQQQQRLQQQRAQQAAVSPIFTSGSQDAAQVAQLVSNYRRTNSPGGPVIRKPSLLGPRGTGSSGLISGGPEVSTCVSNLAAVPLAAVQQLASGAGVVVSAASSFSMVRTNTVELASAHLPALPSMAASMQLESRLLQGGGGILTAGPDILSSILSEGCTRPVGSSFVASGELSRYQSLQGGLSSVLNADTGHVSTTAVEQLRQQLMSEQQAGLGGRPIEVDNLEKVRSDAGC